MGSAKAYRDGKRRFTGATPGAARWVSTDSEGRSASRTSLKPICRDLPTRPRAWRRGLWPLGVGAAGVFRGDENARSRQRFGRPVTRHHPNMDDGDTEAAKARIAHRLTQGGRVAGERLPHRVEVCDAMVHGGPTRPLPNFGATYPWAPWHPPDFLATECRTRTCPQALLPEDLSGASAMAAH